ncbi:protein kilB [Labedaea rhizosphaerae]|uniref:Protein kilB n=1 Tax=Labedaea rhizosphaerae TaxID=598644 RepID=A0A4R6RSC8_LABRH|nr:protein kilB [Labedaea rhizosphaerae]TDP89634.1 hypothetical protein EV186_11234 [Labedaea rhizosphaerae]
MDAMWTSLIAVAGTIAGTNLGAWWNARNARAERNDRRLGEQRNQLLSALADLVSALADHRRAMVVLGEIRLGGGTDQAVAAAVAATHDTRSAISAPLTRVRILEPGLAEHATRATQATYALRDTSEGAELQRLRQAAVDAVAELEKAAGQLWHAPATL